MLCLSMILSFLFLSSVPLDRCITMLFIHSPVGRWAVASLRLSLITCSEPLCMSLCVDISWVNT